MPMRTSIAKNNTHVLQTRQKSSPKRRGPRPITMLFSLLTIIAFIHFAITIHAAYSTPHASNCADQIKLTDYTKYLQLNSKTQQMDAVQFIPQLTNNKPSALVEVTNSDEHHSLDVYVYGCTMQKRIPTISLLFKQQGLTQGTVIVSKANTLITAMLDTTLAPELLSTIEPMQQNVYQEYRWQNNRFTQVLFPSLYPVTSRAEAEILQERASNGETLPWNDALATAEQMAKDLFQWAESDPHDAIIDANQSVAHVQLFHAATNTQVTVTLERLIQPAQNGLWFVTTAKTTGITLDTTSFSAPMVPPITVKGTTTGTSSTLNVTVFDHILSPLQGLNTTVMTTQPRAYQLATSFNNTASGQEGVMLITATPFANATEQGQLLLTPILLN